MSASSELEKTIAEEAVTETVSGSVTEAVTSMVMAPTIPRPVVKISFDSVRSTNERMYPWTKKSGQGPVLQLEVLGDRTNLEDVAKLLFKYHLEDILQESLYSHIWRYSILLLRSNIKELFTLTLFSGK
jgi:hypothetical protein